MDLNSYRKVLGAFRDSYEYDKVDADLADLEALGTGFDAFEREMEEMAAEARRIMAGMDLPVDAELPDRSMPHPPEWEELFPPEPRRASSSRLPDHGGPEMDTDEERAKGRSNGGGPAETGDEAAEAPDAADEARKALQAPVAAAMAELGGALAALDETLELEVRTRRGLKEAAEILARLLALQGKPRLDRAETERKIDVLRGEIEACGRVKRTAEGQLGTWQQIAGFPYGPVVERLEQMAEAFRKRHSVSGFAGEILQKLARLKHGFEKNGEQARARAKRCRMLAERADASAETKERQIRKLQAELARDEELDREIRETGRKAKDMLDRLHRELRQKVDPGQAPLAEGGYSNGRWTLKLAPEGDATHALVMKRMEAVRRCRTLCRAVEKVQPPLTELAESEPNASHVFPEWVSVAETQWTHSGPSVELDVPELAEFPGGHPWLVPDTEWIAPLLLRLAWSMPLGQLEIVALDQARSGQSVQPANDLSDVPGLLTVVTGAAGLQDALGSLDAYMGDLATRHFKHGIENWRAYNERHPRHPLPCKVLAVCSLSGFDTWMSLSGQLRKILDNGGRHGIVPVLCRSALEEADDRTRKALEGVTYLPLGTGRSGAAGEFKRLHGETVVPEMPEDAGERMAELAAAAKKRAERPAKSFGSLFEGVPMWAGKSAEGLSAVVGWDAMDRPVRFKLDTGGEGGTGVHALVGGQTGSGKSVLLHALIQSLAHVYGPDELHFYLFDFKNGVEFRKYADSEGRVWLPHVQVVSIQNDPRYALELFRHLVDVEFKERNERFKKMGVTKIGDYVKKGGKMARLVVVIDEFQELFAEHDGENVGEEVTQGLKAILKQGRNVGVHLVLATQTMASAHGAMKGAANDIMQQIGLRLALWGTGEEGILADNNRTAVTEITPRKQCILNAKTGLKGANTVFDFPFAGPESEDGKAYRARIEAGCRKHGTKCTGKVFDGQELPRPLAGTALRGQLASAAETAHFAVAAGVLPDFAATPLNVAFDNLAGEHLLVAAEDAGTLAGGISPAAAWAGLRGAVLRSLGATPGCAAVYYNPGAASVPGDLPAGMKGACAKATEEELLELFRWLAGSKARVKVAFVENFHKAGVLHPQDPAPSAPLFGKPAAAPAPETARTLFLKAFTAAGVPPFQAVLFTKNAAFCCKNVLGRLRSEANILEACYKRIAFNVTGDTLKTLIPEANYVQLHGPRRVWYEDRKTGSVQAFAPYAER